MDSNDWRMIEQARHGNNNVLSFFKIEKAQQIKDFRAIDVQKFAGISVNGCDFLDLEGKGIVDGGIVISFNGKLPDLSKVKLIEWFYNPDSEEVRVTWQEIGGLPKVETYQIDEHNMMFFAGDFQADVKLALNSMMDRIGDYFMR